MRLLPIALLLVATGTAALAGERRPVEPYFGGREYPDPYIWDGWRSDGGYRGRAYYAATSPYLTRRDWPFFTVYEHRWSPADDIESLSGERPRTAYRPGMRSRLVLRPKLGYKGYEAPGALP